ncbi:Hypothetical predicted protein [Lecanosticta acicola]|uniref:Myb-like domain-containing protein n=1 Tax=Lecanosticta acicola TaxID=111012 RepID=A0AAI9ED66_9PEZI|nr:Hypothetical predicted protein [Lecanosticta acicola]
MTSSQVYPALTGTIDPGQMATHHSTSADIAATEWYAQTSYASHDPFMNPYPASTIEAQPWTTYARASVPGLHMCDYPIHQSPPPQHLQHHQQQQPTPGDSKIPERPRSSPSTFGPSAETIPWTSSGLGIQFTTAGQPTPPVTSTFPPNVFQAYPAEEGYTTSSPPEIRHPQPRRSYTTIAPNPTGAAAKRKRDDDDQQADKAGSSSARKQQRKRTSSVASADLSEDDRFLVQLKEDENLPWKDIATRFQTDKGKNFQVAALQMRYKRLREKFRVWEEQDVQALKLAHEYWEKYKWEIISAKMLDFGIQERWPARHCARKWQELDASTTLATAATPFATPGPPPPAATTTAGGILNTPASISQFSSPEEGAVHFAFMPIQ